MDASSPPPSARESARLLEQHCRWLAAPKLRTVFVCFVIGNVLQQKTNVKNMNLDQFLKILLYLGCTFDRTLIRRNRPTAILKSVPEASFYTTQIEECKLFFLNLIAQHSVAWRKVQLGKDASALTLLMDIVGSKKTAIVIWSQLIGCVRNFANCFLCIDKSNMSDEKKVFMLFDFLSNEILRFRIEP